MLVFVSLVLVLLVFVILVVFVLVVLSVLVTRRVMREFGSEKRDLGRDISTVCKG